MGLATKRTRGHVNHFRCLSAKLIGCANSPLMHPQLPGKSLSGVPKAGASDAGDGDPPADASAAAGLPRSMNLCFPLHSTVQHRRY